MADQWASVGQLKMKYIIVDDGLNDTPILFPEYIDHGNMFSGVKQSASSTIEVLSAGFVSITPNSGTIQVKCFGHSQSLNLRPRDVDSDLIRRHIVRG